MLAREKSAHNRSSNRSTPGPISPNLNRPQGDLDNFAQASGLDFVDEATHRVLAGNERRCLDPRDRLAHVTVEIAERLGGPLRLDTGLFLDRGLELVVGEG